MQYQLSLEEMRTLSLKRKDRKKMEDSLYNSELDLWDTTLLNRLEREFGTVPLERL